MDGGSAQQLGNHVAIFHNLDRTTAGGEQLLVGDDAELFVHGGGHVFDGEGILVRLGGGGVGGAVDLALLETPAGQEDREDLGPVVAALVLVDFGGAAEFAADHDDGAVEEAALFEIDDQCGQCFIEGWHLPAEAAHNVGVVVPAAV